MYNKRQLTNIGLFEKIDMNKWGESICIKMELLLL